MPNFNPFVARPTADAVEPKKKVEKPEYESECGLFLIRESGGFNQNGLRSGWLNGYLEVLTNNESQSRVFTISRYPANCSTAIIHDINLYVLDNHLKEIKSKTSLEDAIEGLLMDLFTSPELFNEVGFRYECWLQSHSSVSIKGFTKANFEEGERYESPSSQNELIQFYYNNPNV